MPCAMRSTCAGSLSCCSSSGVVMKPNSMRQLGMEVSRKTRNPAWWTPLLGRPVVEQTLRCISLAKSTLRSM